MEHALFFYERENGDCQVREYLRATSKRVRGEAGWLLERLEHEGHELERPAADFLEDGIYELRVIVDRQHHRILYFFHGDKIVATNAFLKKSRRIPEAEIARAQAARADWIKREEDS